MSYIYKASSKLNTCDVHLYSRFSPRIFNRYTIGRFDFFLLLFTFFWIQCKKCPLRLAYEIELVRFCPGAPGCSQCQPLLQSVWMRLCNVGMASSLSRHVSQAHTHKYKFCRACSNIKFVIVLFIIMYFSIIYYYYIVT